MDMPLLEFNVNSVETGFQMVQRFVMIILAQAIVQVVSVTISLMVRDVNIVEMDKQMVKSYVIVNLIAIQIAWDV